MESPIWQWRIMAAIMFRFFWVPARGVLERPRIFLWGVARAWWWSEILTGMGSRIWRRRIRTAIMYRSSSTPQILPALFSLVRRRILLWEFARAWWPSVILTGMGSRIWR